MNKDDSKQINDVLDCVFFNSETITDGKLMEIAQAVADSLYDGHYTLMKFTTCYKFMFGTPVSDKEIDNLPQHYALRDALKEAIEGDLELASQALKNGSTMFDALYLMTKEERAAAAKERAAAAERMAAWKAKQD